MTFTEAEVERHNALYKRAHSLIRPYILIDGESRSARPGWFAKRHLRKGIDLFHQALAINPESWQNRFWIAKALQRLGDHKQAMSWFSEALRIEPANVSVAKEAANEALELGEHQLALSLLRPAVAQHPDDPALLHNLGLALLLCGEAESAYQAFSGAARRQADRLTSQLMTLTERVLRGEERLPQRLEDVRRDA